MDFGLARLGGSEMTRTGMVMGTPHYMSPEQVRGERADTRSDIFSLGCVLYELLTYRKAFDAETMHAVLFKVMQEQPAARHRPRARPPPRAGRRPRPRAGQGPGGAAAGRRAAPRRAPPGAATPSPTGHGDEPLPELPATAAAARARVERPGGGRPRDPPPGLVDPLRDPRNRPRRAGLAAAGAGGAPAGGALAAVRGRPPRARADRRRGAVPPRAPGPRDADGHAAPHRAAGAGGPPRAGAGGQPDRAGAAADERRRLSRRGPRGRAGGEARPAKRRGAGPLRAREEDRRRRRRPRPSWPGRPPPAAHRGAAAEGLWKVLVIDPAHPAVDELAAGPRGHLQGPGGRGAAAHERGRRRRRTRRTGPTSTPTGRPPPSPATATPPTRPAASSPRPGSSSRPATATSGPAASPAERPPFVDTRSAAARILAHRSLEVRCPADSPPSRSPWCWPPPPPHAQETPDGLAGLLLRFFSPSNPVVLQAAPDPFSHAAHFVSQPNAQETLRQLNRGIAAQLSTFPLGSSSSGFTYDFDPELGVFNRSTETFGPVFAERPAHRRQGQVQLRRQPPGRDLRHLRGPGPERRATSSSTSSTRISPRRGAEHGHLVRGRHHPSPPSPST